MAFPARGVLAFTVAVDLRPIKDCFDTSAQPACRLGLFRPKRSTVHFLLQHPHDGAPMPDPSSARWLCVMLTPGEACYPMVGDARHLSWRNCRTGKAPQLRVSSSRS